MLREQLPNAVQDGLRQLFGAVARSQPGWCHSLRHTMESLAHAHIHSYFIAEHILASCMNAGRCSLTDGKRVSRHEGC